MNIVQQQIESGQLTEGQRIASELEMSSTYRVNRHTVRQAISELCRTGVLYKIKGRGTFVAKPLLDLVEYRLSPKNRFTENIVQYGKIPGSKLLGQDLINPTTEVATMLKLAADERVYVLTILRLIDDIPFLLTKVYLPYAKFPDLFQFTKNFQNLTAIYDEYGIIPNRVKSMIRASFPAVDEAVILNVPCNMPVLKIESLLQSQNNELIEYNLSCYRGDLAKISVDW
jgi:GntR family transcriptional regulator